LRFVNGQGLLDGFDLDDHQAADYEIDAKAGINLSVPVDERHSYLTRHRDTPADQLRRKTLLINGL
jgi:hypothetical protein